MSVLAAGGGGVCVRRGLVFVCLVGLCGFGCLLVPRDAGAAGGGFGFTAFSVEATKSTLLREQPAGSGFTEVLNEPYVPAYTQAGGHPWALTTKIEFTSEESRTEPSRRPVQDPKDIVVDLPPGLLGDPLATPTCPLAVALNEGVCPASTQIGVYRLQWFGGKEYLAPIVNVTPEPGQTAEFVFENSFKISSILTGHLVRTAQGYGFAVLSLNIPTVQLVRVEATFWGVPGDRSHDPMRGLFCQNTLLGHPFSCAAGTGGERAGAAPAPFLTWPGDCSAGPERASVRADSWEEPGRVLGNGKYEGYAQAEFTLPAVTGCSALRFDPSVTVEPETLLADEPVGMNVTLGVPLDEAVGDNATPQVRDTTLTLPEGLSVSPGVVDGIRACETEGPEGIDIEGPESEAPGLNGEVQLAPGHCPDASTVGTAEAFTPFLPVPVQGHVYLARPQCGDPGEPACTEHDAADGKLYRLYLELGGSGALAVTGVHFKVPLETYVNLATGQLTTRALNTPQAPFSELRIHLNGGPRAPLDNPDACGPAVTTGDLQSWSAPGITPEGFSVQGTPDATPSSFFGVSGCASPPVFDPGFLAGIVTPQAGKFSPFTMNLTRNDREQYIKGIQIHTPPGLLGMLSNVPLCGEPQADQGTCPEASRIGTTRVATGAGSHPFEIEGDVYLTGPYGGQPFGLSIVVHLDIGPYHLGVKVVRARIAVDPENSTLTVTTDETGPYAVPQIVFGVPVRLKRVSVNIDRPDFMFNPTNCDAQQVGARISGSLGAVVNLNVPSAVGGCKTLAFKPLFKVSTSGHTSRTAGASLHVRLSYPKGAMGNDANIARVKVSLPKQLPSYLPTLQKACLAATFNINPAGCPAASVVGIAKATTPLLPVSLSGPVYFVSHGGAEFPSLIIVLQGYGVRVDLTGSTFISKGITSSTFKTIPDVPVNTFELYLPQGNNHALGANANLCTTTRTVTSKHKVLQQTHGHTIQKTITTRTTVPGLVMPTEFVAQNGLVVNQNTNITVTGCKAANARTATHTNRNSRTSRERTGR